MTLAFLLGFAACGSASESDPCALEEGNYLRDADFALEAESSRSRHWTGKQHVGEKSFDVTVVDGVLTIERIGTQPWFLYRQRLDVTDLAGQRVAFTAWLRLVEGGTERIRGVGQAGGLKLAAMSKGNAKFRVERRLAAVEPRQKWQKLQIIAKLPQDTDTLELSFLHKSNGVLEVREPSLQRVHPSAEACVPTP